MEDRLRIDVPEDHVPLRARPHGRERGNVRLDDLDALTAQVELARRRLAEAVESLALRRRPALRHLVRGVAVNVLLRDRHGFRRLGEERLLALDEGHRTARAVDAHRERGSLHKQRLGHLAHGIGHGPRLRDDRERRMLPVVPAEIRLHADGVGSVKLKRPAHVAVAEDDAGRGPLEGAQGDVGPGPRSRQDKGDADDRPREMRCFHTAILARIIKDRLSPVRMNRPPLLVRHEPYGISRRAIRHGRRGNSPSRRTTQKNKEFSALPCFPCLNHRHFRTTARPKRPPVTLVPFLPRKVTLTDTLPRVISAEIG